MLTCFSQKDDAKRRISRLIQILKSTTFPWYSLAEARPDRYGRLTIRGAPIWGASARVIESDARVNLHGGLLCAFPEERLFALPRRVPNQTQ